MGGVGGFEYCYSAVVQYYAVTYLLTVAQCQIQGSSRNMLNPTYCTVHTVRVIQQIYWKLFVSFSKYTRSSSCHSANILDAESHVLHTVRVIQQIYWKLSVLFSNFVPLQQTMYAKLKSQRVA